MYLKGKTIEGKTKPGATSISWFFFKNPGFFFSRSSVFWKPRYIDVTISGYFENPEFMTSKVRGFFDLRRNKSLWSKAWGSSPEITVRIVLYTTSCLRNKSWSLWSFHRHRYKLKGSFDRYHILRNNNFTTNNFPCQFFFYALYQITQASAHHTSN